MKNELMYWAGKSVADMTREELLDTLTLMGKIIERQRQEHDRELSVLARGHYEGQHD